MGLPLVALCLVKESGIFFAAGAAAFMTADTLLAGSGPRAAWSRLRRDRPLARAVAVLAIAPLLAIGSWQAYLATHDDPGDGRDAWGTGLRVIAESSGDASRADEIRARFASAWHQIPLRRIAASEDVNAFNWTHRARFSETGGLATGGWLAAFGFTFALAIVCARRRGRAAPVVASGVFLLGMFVFYEAVLLRLYLTAGEHGLLLSSFVRYTNTILFPMWGVAIAWFSPALGPTERRGRSPLESTLLTVGIGALLVFEPPLLTPLYEPRPAQPFRVHVREGAARVSELVGRDARLFVQIPKGALAGRRAAMLTHELTPTPTTVRSRSLAPNLEEAMGHDYFWLLGPSELFEKRFEHVVGLPAPKPGALYRIDRSAGDPRLTRVLDGLPMVPASQRM
jgi:hypothetical protein